jgi:hypothetical protein
MMCRTLILTAFWTLVVCPWLVADSAYGQSQIEEELRLFREQQHLLMRGGQLSADAARELEKKLETDPDDLELRIPLLGYYWARANSAEARQARQKHVLWLIEHHPDVPFARVPQAQLNHIQDREAYSQAKELWLEQVEKQGEKASVLGNAASFFLFAERDRAEELFKKAQTLEPHVAQWSQQLGHLYRVSMQQDVLLRGGERRRELARKALAQFERAAEQQTDERERFYLLPHMATAAFEADASEKAAQFAGQMLDMSQDIQHDSITGNAIHHGNLILGRLALRERDIAKAKVHLLEAGKTPGSPQLNSFGPNMMLAKELLEEGEKQAVLDYFELCSKFWERGGERLNEWAQAVGAGETPDFRANLWY